MITNNVKGHCHRQAIPILFSDTQMTEQKKICDVEPKKFWLVDFDLEWGSVLYNDLL